jgi:hypothetical protein
MRRRKLYPEAKSARFLFWLAIIFTLGGWGSIGVSYLLKALPDWPLIVGYLTVGPAYYLLSLLLQGRLVATTTDQPYTRAITDINRMVKQLAALSEFLEEERTKVIDSQATLLKLQTEKEQLEPVVLTHKETVNAILAAHAKTVTSKAWKERVVGFVSGLLASLLAALVFEFFRR